MGEEFRKYIAGHPQSFMYLSIMETLTAILKRQIEISEKLNRVEDCLEKILKKLDSLSKDCS